MRLIPVKCEDQHRVPTLGTAHPERNTMRNSKSSLAGLPAPVVAIVVLALAGCGGGSGDDQPAGDTSSKSDNSTAVKQVMADLQTASRAGDGKRICTQIFTPKLADSVTNSAASGSC